MSGRQTAAYVHRRHGAYLITAHGEQANDSPMIDTIDAARALPVAKRLAVEMARSFGFAGAVRWEEPTPGRLWALEMTEVPEPDDGGD